MLLPRGYYVRKDTMSHAELAALKKELTMTPASTMGTPMAGQEQRSFVIYMESPQYLVVPKYFGLRRFGFQSTTTQTQENLDAGDPTGDRLKFAGHLRREQEDPCDAFLTSAQDPRQMGGIISLSCGQGKTVIALNIMSKLSVRTLVVVHKDFLLNQWKERIEQFLPNARIGLVKGKILDVAGHDIILASVQSLSMKEYSQDVFKGVGLLVVDECHRVGTEVFSRFLMKWTFRYSLGLSATVNRKDGMTKAFVNFLGDIVYKGQRRVDTVNVVQVPFSNEDPAYSQEVLIPGIGKPNISRMINNITAFDERNRLIVDHIVEILTRDRGRKVLVLSDRKDQLAVLREYLTSRGTSSGFYYGGLKAAQLAESEQQDVLLATFAYAAEGMDCKALDTLVLASPKSDIEQSCGRILREKACERRFVPLIVDILDKFSLFDRQGAKRRTYYRKNNYTMHLDLQAVYSIDSIDSNDSNDSMDSNNSDSATPSATTSTYAFR